MTKIPKISVLMPIYNTNEEHLRAAIESILNQTETDFEFLILNDSPENIKLDNIVNSYKDSRINYIKNEKNLGITPSRNKLLDLAKGTYLAVMDHDDISLPERFTKEVEVLDNNPNVGVVSSWYKTIPTNKILKYPTSSEEIKKGIISGSCFILHPASMIRNSTLLDYNLKYEEEFSPAEDFALWIKLLEKTEMYNIGEVLFLYREHETNTSKIQKEKMKASRQKIKNIMKFEAPQLWSKYGYLAKKNINFLGIRIFKIKHHENFSTYYLFSFLPLFSITHNK